jgi:hypothetical protein
MQNNQLVYEYIYTDNSLPENQIPETDYDPDMPELINGDLDFERLEERPDHMEEIPPHEYDYITQLRHVYITHPFNTWNDTWVNDAPNPAEDEDDYENDNDNDQSYTENFVSYNFTFYDNLFSLPEITNIDINENNQE